MRAGYDGTLIFMLRPAVPANLHTKDTGGPASPAVINWQARNSPFDWNPVLPYPVRDLNNPANVYLGQYQGTTWKTYASRLRVLAQSVGITNGDYHYLNWRAFDLPQVKALLNAMSAKHDPSVSTPDSTPDGMHRHLSNASLNGILSVIKNVLRQAALMELVSPQLADRVASIRALKVNSGLAGRMAEPDEKARLIACCQATGNAPKGSRDRAILNLLFYAGLRRHEVALMSIEDVDLHQATAVIHGKGRVTQSIDLDDRVISALHDWIDGYRGDGRGALFYRISKTGNILYDRPIRESAIREIMRERCNQAGLVDELRLRPHDARRTFGSELLDVTDIKTAADMMRHSNVNQTSKYDRRTGERRKEALKGLK
ncbi:tyrosine-type recombinase/integrase [Marinobacterium sp. BA1]|uniref:tyrosine-type recombinase/integrase n=1 Tax=Marinobacterium sp. BA1 TaxID=3138931 RepID=UPI0032E63DC6